LSRREERFAEAERDRAGDHCQPQVEQVHHGSDGPSHQGAGALDDLA